MGLIQCGVSVQAQPGTWPQPCACWIGLIALTATVHAGPGPGFTLWIGPVALALHMLDQTYPPGLNPDPMP